MGAFDTLALAVALALTPGLASAADENLLTNGGFGDVAQLVGWETVRQGTDAIWDPLDRAGDEASGSALISMPEGFPGLVFGLEECVAVDEGEVYDLSGWALIPPSAGGGSAYVQVGWYDSEDCGTGFIAVVRSPEIRAPAASFTLTESTDLTAPPGTQTAKIRIVVAQLAEDTGIFTAQFDDIVFVPEPGVAQLGLAGLLAVFALRHTRRR